MIIPRLKRFFWTFLFLTGTAFYYFPIHFGRYYSISWDPFNLFSWNYYTMLYPLYWRQFCSIYFFILGYDLRFHQKHEICFHQIWSWYCYDDHYTWDCFMVVCGPFGVSFFIYQRQCFASITVIVAAPKIYFHNFPFHLLVGTIFWYFKSHFKIKCFIFWEQLIHFTSNFVDIYLWSFSEFLNLFWSNSVEMLLVLLRETTHLGPFYYSIFLSSNFLEVDLVLIWQ